MHLVAGGFQASRIGQHNVGTTGSVLQVVDNHVVQHARFLVFVLHIQVDVVNAIVEHSLGNVQFGRLHLHGAQHLQQVLPRFGGYLVLEMERGERQQGDEDDEWAHGADEGDARGLDGQQFQALADVAERDERCQQNGQWQCGRHQCFGSIKEELHIHV